MLLADEAERDAVLNGRQQQDPSRPAGFHERSQDFTTTPKPLSAHTSAALPATDSFFGAAPMRNPVETHAPLSVLSVQSSRVPVANVGMVIECRAQLSAFQQQQSSAFQHARPWAARHEPQHQGSPTPPLTAAKSTLTVPVYHDHDEDTTGASSAPSQKSTSASQALPELAVPMSKPSSTSGLSDIGNATSRDGYVAAPDAQWPPYRPRFQQKLAAQEYKPRPLFVKPSVTQDAWWHAYRHEWYIGEPGTVHQLQEWRKGNSLRPSGFSGEAVSTRNLRKPVDRKIEAALQHDKTEEQETADREKDQELQNLDSRRQELLQARQNHGHTEGLAASPRPASAHAEREGSPRAHPTPLTSAAASTPRPSARTGHAAASQSKTMSSTSKSTTRPGSEIKINTPEGPVSILLLRTPRISLSDTNYIVLMIAET